MVDLFNDADKSVGTTNVIFRPSPGSLEVNKRFYLPADTCAGADIFVDLAGMDFTFTIAVAAGANMYQFETSSGQRFTADMSHCKSLQNWEEMVKTEAVSAELRLDSWMDELKDYFTTEYMIVQG